MKFLRAEPHEGRAWVREGFRTFSRQPWALVGLFVLFSVFAMLFSLLPILGEVLALALTPVWSLLFMIAGRRARSGERPLPGAISDLRRGGRERLRELVKVSLLYAALVFITWTIVGAIDDGAFRTWMEAAQRITPPLPGMPIVFPALPINAIAVPFGMLVMGVLSVPFWHAPALVFWGGQTWLKSLFFSTVACWRNKGAFSVYGLAWLALLMLPLFLLVIALALLGGSPYTSPLLSAAVSFAMIAYFTVAYCSLWATFAGCFEVEAEPLAAGVDAARA